MEAPKPSGFNYVYVTQNTDARKENQKSQSNRQHWLMLLPSHVRLSE